MTLQYAQPGIHPRVGSSFAIFASGYLCLLLCLLIFEQLGLSSSRIAQIVIFGPAVLYVGVGVFARTSDSDDFFLAGQRVPALYSALSLCAMTFGGSIALGSIGSIFFLGLDGVAIPLGCLAGLLLMGFAFVPYLRKVSAYTLPGFFALRFGRNWLRAFAALIALVPCLMILAAELVIGQRTLEYFSQSIDGQTFGIPVSQFLFIGLFSAVFLTAAFGGMRATSWLHGAQFIVFLCLLVPLITVSVARSNIPLPQLTYGGQLEQLKALEAAKGYVAVSTPRAFNDTLPKAARQPLIRPVERVFSAFSAKDFVMLVLCLAAGIATQPALLTRLGITPTISTARKTIGWVSVVGGLVVLTIPAYAFFVEAMAVEGLVNLPQSDLPAWARALQQSGLVTLSGGRLDQFGSTAQPMFQRDAVALILPVAGGLPYVFLALVVSSFLSAILACASGQLLAIGAIIGDDLFGAVARKPLSTGRKLFFCRAGMGAAGVALFFMVGASQIDPLRLVMSALSLSAGSFFSVLVLSVWWRRLSGAGAFFGMASGFAVTAMGLLYGSEGLVGISPLLSGIIGIPVSLIAAVAASQLLGEPDQVALDAVDELRIPAGETLQARGLRIASRTKVRVV